MAEVTAPVLDERPQVAALRALLDTELGTDSKAYELGTVPGANGITGTLPDIYVTVQLERRYAPPVRLRGVSVTGWRVTVLGAGRTAREARWALARIATALETAVLQLEGRTSTPLRHESSRGVAPDATRHTGTHTYVYAL